MGAAAVAAGGLLASAPAYAAVAGSPPATAGTAPAECDPRYLGPVNPLLISSQRFATTAVGPIFERPPR